MKTAFVLAGGGAAGSYQLGCLKAVLKAGIKPDLITANSAGALNATGLSFGDIDELEKVWLTVKSRQDIFANKFLPISRMVLGGKSIWNSKPLKKLIEGMIKGKEPKIPLWVNYVDLRDGCLYRAAASNSRSFVDSVLASASIPIITEPVRGYMVDGGVRENTPLKFAIDEGAERIFVFMNSPRARHMSRTDEPQNIIDIAVRTLEIIANEAHFNDIDTCMQYNLMGRGRPIDIHFIAPKVRKVGTLDFTQDKIQMGIEQGFSDAEEYLYSQARVVSR